MAGGESRVARRSFLRGLGAGVGGTAVVAGAAGGIAAAATSSADAEPAASAGAVPFHGAHQAGVAAPPSAGTTVLACDVTAQSRSDLTDLFRTLTDRARFLTAGGTPAPTGISEPPPDSGVLGPVVPADNLIVTVGVGASLFDERFGLASAKPAYLTPMPVFPNDALIPAWCHGDLSLQLSADHPDTVHHALRDITRATRGGMQVRWRIDGTISPPRPSGTPRNYFGFKDGISNPDVTDAAQLDSLVWARSGAPEPAWTTGGSYLVVRLIRMLTEFWDRISVLEQENMFGRRRDTGAPLDADDESDPPNYAADPTGSTIPLTSHIRLANPRTPLSADSRILRRGYNYDLGMDAVGDLDVGLIFTAYQQNTLRQFEAVQARLAGEPLDDYISPFGGGYFFALPGVRDTSDYFARGLPA